MSSPVNSAFKYEQRRAGSRPLKNVAAHVADIILFPFIAASCFLLKGVRVAGLKRMPVSRALFDKIGLLPVRNHYFEPLFTYEADQTRLNKRELPAFDFNISEQRELLSKFQYQQELLEIPVEAPNSKCSFYYNNGSYLAGDAEFLYSLIRYVQPKRIVEVGSGNSTLMVRHALKANSRQDPKYSCQHICIEPYEQPWLEKEGVDVIRRRVEDVNMDCFNALESGDILFIDSSHIIRLGGDVLFLFQQVLPRLRQGVYVHIHDIFSPWYYPEEWLVKEKRLWNEQYLLESFMALNDSYSVVAMLFYLSKEWRVELSAALPVYGQNSSVLTPGAFWMRRSA